MTFLTKSAFLGQAGAGSPVSGWTGFVCALGEAEGLEQGWEVQGLWPGREGDVLGLAAHHSPSSLVPAQGFELWECLPEKTRGVKWCQREARSGEGEQQGQVVVCGSCLSTECWSRLSSLGTQGTGSHPP